MSEFNPFGPPEQAPAQAEVAEEQAADSRKKVLLLGTLAAVVLGAGAFLFLGGSDAETDEFTAVTRSPRAAAVATPAPALKKLPVTTRVTLGRNPFRALYVAPAGASGPAGGTAPVTTTQTGTTTVAAPAPVVVAPAPAPVSGGAAPAPAAPAPAQPAPARPAPAPAPAQSTVALKGVAAGKDGSNPTGTFVYDGKTVTGAPGDVMAGKLLVISLQRDNTGGWFANLQLGDGSPFEVHERQTVVVQ